MGVNEKPSVEAGIRALLVAGMAGCVAISLAELGRMIVPGWNGAYVVVGAVVAALEASYSYHLIEARELHGTALLRFRAVELVILAVLVRIGSFVGHSWAEILAEISAWPRQPMQIISLEAAGAYVVVLLSWLAATQTAHDLERLDDPPHLHRGEAPPTNAITARFFWGGAVLLLAAGLTRIGIAALLELEFPPVPRLVVNVLVYFLLGLALLGQAHFVRLRRQWRTQETAAAGGLAGRWVRYSLILLAMCALIALLLPTRYTVGLLDVIAQIIGVIVYALGLIGLVFSFIIGAIIHLFQSLLSLFMGEQPATEPLRFRVPPMEVRPVRPGMVGPDWLDVVRSVFFWAVALGVLAYLVRTYLRDHPELLETLGRLKIVRGLRSVLQAIWRRLVGIAQEAQERLAARVARRRAGQGAIAAAIRMLRPSTRSPRDRVLYYYLSILERARTQGLARKPAQTPNEYQTTFARRLPDLHEDMDALTRAFVEARYSDHSVGHDMSDRVRTSWQKVREALRTLQRRVSR